MTPRERIINKIIETLTDAEIAVLRDSVVPERIPDSGLVIVRDGADLEQWTVFSPLRYVVRRTVVLELYAQGDDEFQVFDALYEAVRDALLADTTLGGLVDALELGPLSPEQTGEGAVTVRSATLPVFVWYEVAVLSDA